MKAIAKNLSVILTSFALLTSITLFTSCEKETTAPQQAFTLENAQLALQASVAEDGEVSRAAVYTNHQNRIYFDVREMTCVLSGTSLEVLVDRPENYAYLWQVNGRHNGHDSRISCACGEQATVHVMRLRDGARASKTIQLTKCIDDSPNN